MRIETLKLVVSFLIVEFIIKLAFILVIVINIKVVKTKASFLA